MQIIHTKDYVPACTSNLCGFMFNTHGPTSALMEYCESSEINKRRHTTESSYDFRTFRPTWRDNCEYEWKGFTHGYSNVAKLVLVRDGLVYSIKCLFMKNKFTDVQKTI